MTPATGEITSLLKRHQAGDEAALPALAAIVYEDLRRQARKHVRGLADSPLQATALVHEAWIKVFARSPDSIQNRRHLFGAFANAMRQIVVDSIRGNRAAKRSAPASGLEPATPAIFDRMAPVSDLLDQLERISSRQAEIVRLRVFAGCPNSEIAELLGLGLRTVEREWRAARAWLKLRLASDQAA